MKILVTGSAGFIGAALVRKLLNENFIVAGIDNHNDYYSQELKESRIKDLVKHSHYEHHRFDIANKDYLEKLFDKFKPEIVVNLAAQAGVRYSLTNPHAYINSNIVGFVNILECAKCFKTKHLVYASSSSVYGDSKKLPFSESDVADHPVSFYAATKKSNELMAHSYSHLYNLPTTGLRFFTVYGPWGRPDMAYFKFTKAILEGKTIDIYNEGHHKRDFTYIDDIVEGVFKIINKGNQDHKNDNKLPQENNRKLWNIYNIGNSESIKLIDFIEIIENKLCKKAKKNYLPMQLGDVRDTYADISNITRDFNFDPKVSINEGIELFFDWYKKYFNIN